MKREDLFLAIGMMDDSRLARTELAVNGTSAMPETEDKTMKKRNISAGRILRNGLIAAVLVSMLAVTAYAVTGFLLYDSPGDMLTAMFGDRTGFDHNPGSITPDPDGGPEGILVEPTFDRVPADPTVVEDIASHLDIVGRSISWEGYTLTVDAFMYDSATRCGFFTYLLENPQGVSGYQVQSTGEIWYEGGPDIVSVNQYGYPFLIREKTTDTCLAASYYFQYDRSRGEALDISFTGDRTEIPDEEINGIITKLEQELRTEMTPEEAVDAVIDRIGKAVFDSNTGSLPEDDDTRRADYAYTVLAHERFREEYQETGAKLTVALDAQEALANVTMEQGSVLVSPISMQIDVTDLSFLHETRDGALYIHGDNVDSVILRFADGTEYVVEDGYTLNYTFAHIGSASGGEQDTVNLVTYLFNRIIDIDQLEAVVINGTELKAE